MRDPNAVKSTLASAMRLLTAEGLIDFNGHMRGNHLEVPSFRQERLTIGERQFGAECDKRARESPPHPR